MIRIVKMEFAPEYINNFKNLFEERKNKIRNCEGCTSLTLLQDNENPTIFFTYSKWQHSKYLEMYRTSELFKDTWQTVKKWFDAPAEAWSVSDLVNL